MADEDVVGQWLEWAKENTEEGVRRWWGLMAPLTNDQLQELTTVTLEEAQQRSPGAVNDEADVSVVQTFARYELLRRLARAKITTGAQVDRCAAPWFREEEFLKHNAVAATATNHPDDWACVDYGLDEQSQS